MAVHYTKFAALQYIKEMYCHIDLSKDAIQEELEAGLVACKNSLLMMYVICILFCFAFLYLIHSKS